MSKTVVLYREGNSDSLEFAQYYASIHQLQSQQIIPVPCSGTQILADYFAFQEEIENSVISAIEEIGDVNTIVVGYGVPGGFYDGIDVVSSTSRLSRIDHAYSKMEINPLFGRTSNRRLLQEDASTVIVCSRIDAPTLAQAKAMVNKAVAVMKKRVASGVFYLDAHPFVSGDTNKQSYENDLVEFATETLPLLNIDTFQTKVKDGEDVDLIIPFLRNDSFMWGCGAANATSSFFQESAASRVFLYNADTNNAADVRNASSTRWASLGILNGYAAVGGSMSYTSAAQYLRPRPFFESLLDGATIGEAYLFSVPYLNSPETLFGDPLVSVIFPAEIVPETMNSVELGTDMMIHHLSQAVAAVYRIKDIADQINTIADNYSVVEPDFYTAAANWASEQETQYMSEFVNISSVTPRLLLNSSREQINSSLINDFLDDNDLKIGRLFVDVLETIGTSIDSSFLSSEGEWRFETPIMDSVTGSRVLYHFILEIATDDAFDDILITKDSSSDQSDWTYQKEVSGFIAVPSTGVSSSYAGRTVRCVSGTDLLDRGHVYHVRLKQKIGTTEYDNVTERMAVYS